MPELSLADELALLPPDERDAILADLDTANLEYDWNFWGRPNQILPADDSWDIALALAGRGWGKSRAASEWARHKALSLPGSHGIIVARTAADVRDVMVEGSSGILATAPPDFTPHFEPSKRRLTWPNGTTATTYSADEPDQLRGPQSNWSVADEIATWSAAPDASGLTSWDNLRIATRDGDTPQLLALTTPKRTPLIRDLLKESSTNPRLIIRRGTTRDNEANLAASYLDAIYGKYAGTSLARQELEGELLEDVEGALWTLSLINAHRLPPPPDTQLLVVVGVDPSVAESPADECGIVVVATPYPAPRDLFRRHVYILADHSLNASPDEWASQVAAAAYQYADHSNGRPAPIIAEINQGGALVTQALVTKDPNLRVLPVRARYGKLTRAEPIAMATQQGRLHFPPTASPDPLPFLADQLASWTPSDRKSPDRLDALVWACTALLISPPPQLHAGPITAHAPRSASVRPPGANPSNPSGPSRRRARALTALTVPGTPGPYSTSTGTPRGWLPPYGYNPPIR